MIKVFLSSTFEDLTEHRKAVLEVLHRMKADVEAMEYFGSRPDGPEAACIQEINECNDPIGNVAASWMARAQAPAGNLRRNSLREIWNSDAAFDVFRAPCASSRCAVREATSAPG